MELVDQMFESDSVCHIRLYFHHFGQILDNFLEVHVVIVRNLEVVNERRYEVKLDSLATSLSDFPDASVMPGVVAHINRLRAFAHLIFFVKINLTLGGAEDLENIP